MMVAMRPFLSPLSTRLIFIEEGCHGNHHPLTDSCNGVLVYYWTILCVAYW